MSDTTTGTESTETTTTSESEDVDWKARFEEMQAQARKHEDRAKTNASAAKELERLKAASMSEQEKAVAEARAEARKEMLGVVTDRLVRAEVRAAAAGRLADPGDAAALLGDLSRFVGDDGEVDGKAVVAAIEQLVKAKPYLAKVGNGAGEGGARGGVAEQGFSMDDWLRGQVRK